MNSIVLLAQKSFSLSSDPGALRRSLLGSPSRRLQLPQTVIDHTVSALKKEKFQDSLPHLTSAIKNVITSVSTQSILEDPFLAKTQESTFNMNESRCLLAQQEAKSRPQPRFIYEITPESAELDPANNEAQKQWFADNSRVIQSIKQTYGCIYFKGWEILKDQDGLSAACHAMDMDICADPAQIVAPRPALDGVNEEIFEASNNPADSQIHIGMHNEVTPGAVVKSAFFACFKSADSGGEFLLCDGRQVLRDINTDALAKFQERGFKAVLAEMPQWLSQAPGPLRHLPLASRFHHEFLSFGVDLATPNAEYALSSRLGKQKESVLALTSVKYSPITRHHDTGEAVWFCSIDASHRDIFEKRNPNAMGGKFDTRGFDMVYGDGRPITGRVLHNTIDAIEKNTKAIAMKPGDGVFLDNLLTMHGRKPFTGERKHAVVWFSN